MFLHVGSRVVEQVLDQPPQEDGEGEQHEDAGHKPGREGGLSVFPEQLPHQQRQQDEEDDQVE